MDKIYYYYGGMEKKVAILVDDFDDLDEVVSYYVKEFTCPINLIKLDDGIVIDCKSGILYEVNNEIFYTYYKYHQPYNLMIKGTLDRDIDKKTSKVLDYMLFPLQGSLDTRHLMAAVIKDKGYRLSLAKGLNFNIEKLSEGYLKDVSFQMLQLMYLLQDREVYDTDIILKEYPQFAPVFRGEDSVEIRSQMNLVKNLLIVLLKKI